MNENELASKAFAVTPDTYREPLDVIGVAITVLATKEATRGYEVTLQRGPAGVGPRKPHAHPWDESFFVLEGRVVFDYDGRRIEGTPGTFVHIPANEPHGFHFGEGGGAMLEMTGAGSFSTRAFELISKGIAPTPENLIT